MTTMPKAAWRWTRGFPDAMGERVYYQPVERGLEIQLKQKLDDLRRRREAARRQVDD